MRQSQTSPSPTIANGHSESVGKQRPLKLPPDTLEFLILSLKKQWKCYRKQLRKCQRRFSERSVHDLRVSARRLLSLLDLLAHFLAPGRLKKAQGALKRHLDTFDDLRDTQVQLPAVRKFRGRFPAAARFHRFLKKREARLIRLTCKKARRLRSQPLSKLMSAARADVKAWLRKSGSRQPNPLLLSAVNRAFSLTRQLKERIQPEDTHSIHCTRVAFKRFRYVIEDLADHLPWANESLQAKMHYYQTLMGDIQDSEVLLRVYQKFLRKHEADIESGLPFDHELQERRRRLIAKYIGAADQLLEFWPPAGEFPRAGRAGGVSNGQQEERQVSRADRAKRKSI